MADQDILDSASQTAGDDVINMSQKTDDVISFSSQTTSNVINTQHEVFMGGQCFKTILAQQANDSQHAEVSGFDGGSVMSPVVLHDKTCLEQTLVNFNGDNLTQGLEVPNVAIHLEHE